jgi:hypothetical protein
MISVSEWQGVDTVAHADPRPLAPDGSNGRARVMLVDDQRLFRRGAHAALAHAPGVEVVGDIENGDDAVQRVVAANPEVVLLGELSGGWDVFAAAVRQHLPRAGLVVLLDRITEEDLFYALKAGACACRPRTISAERLVDVVRQAAQGECVIHLSDVTCNGPSRRIMARPGLAPKSLTANGGRPRASGAGAGAVGSAAAQRAGVLVARAVDWLPGWGARIAPPCTLVEPDGLVSPQAASSCPDGARTTTRMSRRIRQRLAGRTALITVRA